MAGREDGKVRQGGVWVDPDRVKPGGGKGTAVKPPSFGGEKGKGTKYCRDNGSSYWSPFGPKSNQDKPCPPAAAGTSKKSDPQKGAY